jgi:hypothetical protein
MKAKLRNSNFEQINKKLREEIRRLRCALKGLPYSYSEINTEIAKQSAEIREDASKQKPILKPRINHGSDYKDTEETIENSPIINYDTMLKQTATAKAFDKTPYYENYSKMPDNNTRKSSERNCYMQKEEDNLKAYARMDAEKYYRNSAYNNLNRPNLCKFDIKTAENKDDFRISLLDPNIQGNYEELRSPKNSQYSMKKEMTSKRNKDNSKALKRELESLNLENMKLRLEIKQQSECLSPTTKVNSTSKKSDYIHGIDNRDYITKANLQLSPNSIVYHHLNY